MSTFVKVHRAGDGTAPESLVNLDLVRVIYAPSPTRRYQAGSGHGATLVFSDDSEMDVVETPEQVLGLLTAHRPPQEAGPADKVRYHLDCINTIVSEYSSREVKHKVQTNLDMIAQLMGA